MWESANLHALKSKHPPENKALWFCWYIPYLCFQWIFPLIFFTGGLIAFLTVGIWILPIQISRETWKIKKIKLIILLYIPNLILTLIGGAIGIPFASFCLAIYYVALIIFFLRLMIRYCCSCRKVKSV